MAPGAIAEGVVTLRPGERFLELVKAGDADGVRAALARDPELIRARAETGVGPLLLALYHGQDAVAEVLRAASPELDLFESAAIGDADRVAALLRHDPSTMRAHAPDGYHALGLAAFFGRRAIVSLLLDAGADVNAPSRNAMQVMPLHSAVASRNRDAATEVVRLLIDRGADVNASQAGGWTPLHQAASAGCPELVRLFLDRGADPGAASTGGKTPADVAAERGHAELAQLLRDRSGGNDSLAK